jgi:hypothetical protein
METQQSQREQRLRLLPAAGILAGGAAYSLLPRGEFGTHDVLVRAFISGTVAGVSTLLLTWIMQRKNSKTK